MAHFLTYGMLAVTRECNLNQFYLGTIMHSQEMYQAKRRSKLLYQA